jgi:hypothetical protein
MRDGRFLSPRIDVLERLPTVPASRIADLLRLKFFHQLEQFARASHPCARALWALVVKLQ